LYLANIVVVSFNPQMISGVHWTPEALCNSAAKCAVARTISYFMTINLFWRSFYLEKQRLLTLFIKNLQAVITLVVFGVQWTPNTILTYFLLSSQERDW